MKTMLKFSFVRTLLLLAASLSLSTSYAAAQSVERGTFTLPVETHWGISVLPAGTYSFSAETTSSFPIVTVRSMDGKISGMFVAGAISASPEGSPQRLTLTRRGEDMYVSSLQLSELEMTLEYRVPKAAEVPAVARLSTP